MITKHKMQELQELAAERGPLCVGLDTDPSYLPDSVIKAVGSAEEAVLAYNKEIIRRIAADKSACCCKVQIAYYEAMGLKGMKVYAETLKAVKEAGLIAISDIKRGDIAATADSIDVFSQKLRDMSPAQIGEFLSYDTANRQELISYATQYASMGTTALENMKNAVSNYNKSIANLNEQIATLNEQYESSKNELKSQIENINKQIAQIELNKRKDELNAQKEHYSALIALYKNQKRFAENLN